jgi:tetratricopeptide (TPR) repeat protein
MQMENSILDCFFVAPFGDKEHQMGGGTMPHFELVRSAVKEIMESFPDAPIRLRRADEIADVGSVQETFIGALQKADIVVAELSATGNANVFYELGIRFALRRAITIPIWQTGTKIPADLQGLLGIEYEPSNPIAQREQFYKFLRSRLGGSLIDSPVYRVLPHLHVADASEIQALTTRVQELEKALRETKLDVSVQHAWDEAEGLLSKGDTSAALDTLKIAYDVAPKNVRLAVRYGQLLSRAEKHDEAISTLHAAAALATEAGGPKFIPFRELGMAYKRAGKPQLAIDWLIKAVEENPRDSDTQGIIGGVHKDAYEIDKAIDSYQRGFDGDPKSTYCLLNILCLLMIRSNSGDRLRSKRLLPIADTLTAQAMESKGADQWTMYDRAHFLAFADRESEAKELFAQAIEETKSIGELRSARKNLDLLKDAGTDIPGLPGILSLFDDGEAAFPK